MIRVQLADADRVIIASLEVGTLPEGIRHATRRLQEIEGARYARVQDITPGRVYDAASWEFDGDRLYPRNNLVLREI